MADIRITDAGDTRITVASDTRVTASGPFIESLTPNTVLRPATLNVVIIGNGTNFINAMTTADFGSNITVNSVTVGSSTYATANITVTSMAAPGARTVTITTGTEVVYATLMFSVTVGNLFVISSFPSLELASGPGAARISSLPVLALRDQKPSALISSFPALELVDGPPTARLSALPLLVLRKSHGAVVRVTEFNTLTGKQTGRSFIPDNHGQGFLFDSQMCVTLIPMNSRFKAGDTALFASIISSLGFNP